ncbi:MAG TPA: YkgJ family cysteine cluster protein [Polyangiaceae bacterium]
MSDEARATVSCHCSTCPRCCEQVRVPITHRDVRRLVDAVGASASSFMDWLAPEEVDMSGEPESFVELTEGRRIMMLRHENAACHLLDCSGRCSQYAARPAACAAYPFAFSDGTALQSRRLTILSDAPCTCVDWGNEDETQRAVSCVEAELNDYVAIVKRWNKQQTRRRFAGRRPRSASAFIEWLMNQPGT